MKKLLFLAALVACGGGDGGTVEKIEGTASIGGKAVTITSCKAVAAEDGEKKYVTLELGLDSGHTVVVDNYAGSKVRNGGETTKLACTRTSGESRHGRAGSNAWATGTLDLACTLPEGELSIAATYDCGSTSRPSNLK